MTPERWQQIKQTLDAVVVLQGHARSDYLAGACAGDAELRHEVESLLASHDKAGDGFLETPIANLGRASSIIRDDSTRTGQRIGAYDVVERIGRGGMGDVYRAVRADGHFTKEVALKLVRTGFDSAFIVERFRHERQILAGLDHPNIARLLDGGTTGDGVPFLVMEIVEGEAIDSYCNTRRLGLRDRLRLFEQVCAAVQYAHQRLVVHRDLKPSNILVTNEGIPKLLDFGIAKILDSSAGAEVTLARPMTPEYASPEQIQGEPITTATDVYSLGVILYRLLTGRSPYRLESESAGALADAIRTQEPERPSTVTLRPDGAPSAQHPQSQFEQQLRGDLDVIVLKALRKEPEKRYSSVEQLTDDIRRHLDGRPVSARKGTWSYGAGKFVGRHRVVVAAMALVLVTLVGGTVISTREARIAEANRRRADARFNDVRKLANSLIFEVHDSIQYLEGATDARKLILQRALEYLDGLAKESGNEPDLVRELATAYSRIGVLQSNEFRASMNDAKAAAVSYQKALAMREAIARSNPRSSRDQVELAGAYIDYGEFQSGSVGNVQLGLEYEQRALAILDREAQASPDDQRIMALTRTCLTTLGLMQVGNGLMAVVGSPIEGVSDLQRALRLTERAAERSPSDERLTERRGALESMIGIGFLYLGDRAAALAQFRRALELLEPLARSGHNLPAAINAAVLYGKMGDALLIDGRTSEALPDYLEDERRVSRLAAGDQHNEFAQQQEAIALVEVGHALVELDRTDEGLTYIRRSLQKVESDSSDAPLTRAIEALVRGWFGEALERQGRIREAAHEYAVTKEKLGALRAKGVNDARMQGYFAAAADRLGNTFAKLGETDNAIREYDEAVRVLEPVVQAYPADQELTYALAETYTAEGTLAAARAERASTRAERLTDWQTASEWFGKSLNAWKKIPHPARISTSGFEVTLPAEVSSRRAHADREIRSLGGVPSGGE